MFVQRGVKVRERARLIREIGVGVGGAGGEAAGVAADGGDGRSGEDDEADVADRDLPVGGVARAGVLDDNVAEAVHIDAAVGSGAVVALDAVVGASGVDARAVAGADAVKRTCIGKDCAFR